ncbi:PEP/pyruvate-binding domain-containing protein [Nonomuraea jiangxiensis]|uniref:Pyruvate, water dikinase n=1 Tax=Nonomuraea jiangxiensis TaxID=633440 RepID=A0A1G7YYW5_9ACTN|nr:PEP/pyruvate-binding domain-containing protein [Nonomuraea jiangxiensis]SDH01718.1 pyruvate, water dikinase [Nonomuraea jiangxiensis]
MRAVIPLDDAAADLATAGGKGASLARLARAGLPVPGGFHITTGAYRAFVSGFREEILRAAAEGDPDRIAALFEAHDMPGDLAEEIRRAYAALGPGVPVAVRSSATAEDLPDLSFAGQQDTYLNVRGEDLPAAVKRCWASLWNPRAVAYRDRNGVPHDDVALAVVVQELVDADAAGVMFTANPVNGARDEIVVNASWGLGEAVVGGQVTPDTVVVSGGAVTSTRLGDKAVMTVRTAAGTEERPVPSELRGQAVLDAAEAVTLAGLGARVQALYGTPMDVEWARHAGTFAILQARPITGLQPRVEEWNDSLKGEYLWTGGNLGEAIPDVMTPLTWSFVRLFIHEAMSSSTLPGYDVVGNIGGRFYMNLSVAYSMARAVGMQSRLSAVEQVFGRIPPGLDVPMVPTSRWRLVKLVVPLALRMRRRVRENLRGMRAFLATSQRRCEELRARIAATGSGPELADLWAREIEPHVVTSCRMLEAAGRQGGATLVFTRDRLRRMMGEVDAEAMLTGVNAGGELASLGPVMGLTRLARGEITRDEFARTYGHRGPHEFEVSIPRPGEDPGWIDAQLAGLRDLSSGTEELLARQAGAREEAWARFARRYPGKEAGMRARVQRWNAVVRDREAARSENMRAFWVLRAFAVRAGELTGHGDDVFFLDLEELLALLRGDPAGLERVPVRRATHERYAALPPYPVLIVGHFDPVRWAADPDRRADLYDARGGGTPVSETVTGFPGAPGVVEGVARVISGPEEGERLKAGEILVTTLTNVGWTPMFPRAAAVVTDMGAPLSHASIVARELGIPAVVGTGNATMRLHDGDRIRVDGERGTVELLAPEESAESVARETGG